MDQGAKTAKCWTAAITKGEDCEAILSFVIDAGTPRCRNVSMGRKRPEGGLAPMLDICAGQGGSDPLPSIAPPRESLSVVDDPVPCKVVREDDERSRVFSLG